MPVLRTKTNRMWLPDALRGLALLNMLVYHGMYDWVYVFGHASRWYDIWAPGCHVWQQYICWSFIVLSGFSFPLARKPVKNGLLVAGCAAVLTAVTAVCMPSEAIWFGVLHLNAAAVLLTCLVYPLLQRVPAGMGLATSAALFALTNQLPYGYLGFENWHLCALPAGLYKANWFWLGLPDLTRFTSADYVLVRRVFGAAVAPEQGRGPGCGSAALCCWTEHAVCVYAAPARDLWGAVGVA